MGGKAFGLADLAAGAALGYLDVRFAEIDWRTRHPHLASLFERLSARESFKTTVPAPQPLRDRVV
ncbi:MAG: glutathione S-transferase C-terminal domain-containing protein [Gammaproteobacteria bacterium]